MILPVDTNVLLDVLAHRQPHYEASARVGASYLIPRDPAGFPRSGPAIVTPAELPIILAASEKPPRR